MKLFHVILFMVLVAGVVIVIYSLNDASTYADFDKAEMLGKIDEDSEVHIVGEMKKDSQGNIVGMHYDPVANPNLFSFILKDEKGREERVTYFAPKPADIDKSEKVVIVAQYTKTGFIAKQILLKCPSKYNEETIETASN